MHLPGFSAEASLAEAHRYQSTVTPNQRDGVVQPAALGQRVNNRFWGCTDTYCGCDNVWDCMEMATSGACDGRKMICTRVGCVCI